MDTSLTQSLILGLVQGLTEFIPISSTAHLRIIPEILGWEDPGTEFSAVLQIGTQIAVFVYFRHDILKISKAALISLKKCNPFYTMKQQKAMAHLVDQLVFSCNLFVNLQLPAGVFSATGNS